MGGGMSVRVMRFVNLCIWLFVSVRVVYHPSNGCVALIEMVELLAGVPHLYRITRYQS